MNEKNTCWGLSADGTIKFQLLTQEYLQPALNLMRDSFFCEENVCLAVGVPDDPEAMQELEQLAVRAAKDGVTVIAVDKSTDKVVAAAFNKILVRDSPEQDVYFENFAKNCKSPSTRAVVEYMIQADSLVNLFDICKIDCVMEVMFGATSLEYRGKGIATKLREISIEVARTLIKGVNVKQSIDGTVLNLEPVPKAVSSILSSFITQKIYKNLGFQIAAEQSFEEYYFQGATYASKIGSHTPSTTVVYKKLV